MVFLTKAISPEKIQEICKILGIELRDGMQEFSIHFGNDGLIKVSETYIVTERANAA